MREPYFDAILPPAMASLSKTPSRWTGQLAQTGPLDFSSVGLRQ
jgi:hypothetical protein